MLYVESGGSGKSIVGSVVDECECKVFEGECPSSRAGLLALMTWVGEGAKLVVVEAGNQLKWVAESLKRLPAVQLHVINANESKWISASSGKTDRINAKKLAELVRGCLLPRAVHEVEGQIRDLRALLSVRQ